MNDGPIVFFEGEPPPGVIPIGPGVGIQAGEDAASGGMGAFLRGVGQAAPLLATPMGAPAAVASGLGSLFGYEVMGGKESEQLKSASEAAAAEQARTLEETQALAEPYAAAGEAALQQQQALAGLLGPDAQAAAIAQLESSPQFQSMLAQGERAILQNAAATGGLRGGNVQAMLAQFRPQLLSSIIEQQYGRLAGLAGTGLSAAGAQMGVGSELGAVRAGGQLSQAQLDYMEAQRRQQNIMGALAGGTQLLGALAGIPPVAMAAAPAAAGFTQGGQTSQPVYGGEPTPRYAAPMQNAAEDYGIA